MTEQDFIDRFTALVNHAGPILSKIASAPVELLDNAVTDDNAEYATGVRKLVAASKAWLASAAIVRGVIADAIAKGGTT